MAYQKTISETSLSQKQQTIDWYRLFVIICTNHSIYKYIQYTYFFASMWRKSLETLNLVLFSKNNASSLHLTPRSPQKSGHLKGAEGELRGLRTAQLLFGLGAVAGGRRIPMLTFHRRDLRKPLLPKKPVCYGSQTQGTYELLQDLNEISVSIMTHKCSPLFTPWCIRQMQLFTRLWPFVLQVSARLGFAWTVAISSNAASQASCQINMLQCSI